MTSIQDFFAAQAAAFSRNDLKEIARGFQTPARIIVGNSSLYLNDLQSVQDAATIYRTNLETEGYHHSDVDILHVHEGADGTVRTLAQWRDLNTQGVVINQIEGSYFCHINDNGKWQVTLMEVLDAPPSRLLSGLAIL